MFYTFLLLLAASPLGPFADLVEQLCVGSAFAHQASFAPFRPLVAMPFAACAIAAAKSEGRLRVPCLNK